MKSKTKYNCGHKSLDFMHSLKHQPGLILLRNDGNHGGFDEPIYLLHCSFEEFEYDILFYAPSAPHTRYILSSHLHHSVLFSDML